MNAHTEYTLQILLPDPIERLVRDWAVQTPGATSPSSGGHITLLGAFVPTRPLDAIQSEIENVCAGFAPFAIQLDRVVNHPHWLRPHLKAVLLVGESRREDYRTLLRLQRELSVTLAPLKRDAHPEFGNRDYNPHVSLTWGLPEPEAARLVESARAARLEIKFTVEEFWLLEFVPTTSEPYQVNRIR